MFCNEKEFKEKSLMMSQMLENMFRDEHISLRIFCLTGCLIRSLASLEYSDEIWSILKKDMELQIKLYKNAIE